MYGSGFTVVPRDQWPQGGDRQNCASCGKAPSVFKPYDHCQACGRLCCSGCLGQQLVLPGHPGTAPVPVCTHCAQQIRRAHQDAEMAVHRCKILEDMLNEQSLQTEKLLGQTQALREENDALLQDKKLLEAKIRQLDVDLEVAAAKASLASVASPVTAAAPAVATSPTTAAVSSPTTTAAAAGADAQKAEAALEKKRKQLDMRELTLQEALKKVSNDAAKIVSQRQALQEEEKRLKSTLTEQFSTVFEKERTQMERVYLSEIAKMAADFSRLVKDQKLSHASKSTYHAQMDRVRKEYERKIEELSKRAGRVEELERTLEEVQSANTSMLLDASQSSLTPPPTEVEHLREDLDRQLEEVKRTYEAEGAKLRAAVEELQMAQKQQRTVADIAARQAAEALAHQERQIAQLQSELEEKEKQQQLQQPAAAGISAEELQQERERLQADHAAELAKLRDELYTAEQVEEIKAALRASLEPPQAATQPPPPAEPTFSQADVEREKTAALKAAHQLWETKHSLQLRQLKAVHDEAAQKMSAEYETLLDALRREVAALRDAHRTPSPVPLEPSTRSGPPSVASANTSLQSEGAAPPVAAKDDAAARRQVATLKKNVQHLEKQLKEQSLLVLTHKRTIATLNAEIEEWKEKLSKQQQAARRASTAAAKAPPAVAAAPAAAPAAPQWAAAGRAWAQARLQLVEAYTQQLAAVVDVYPTLAAEVVAAGHAEAQRQEEIRLRNAAALGRTTESMRGLQSELRHKAEQLREREEGVAAREAQLEGWERELHEKKVHIMNCCVNLRKVTNKIKEQEGQAAWVSSGVDC